MEICNYHSQGRSRMVSRWKTKVSHEVLESLRYISDSRPCVQSAKIVNVMLESESKMMA